MATKKQRTYFHNRYRIFYVNHPPTTKTGGKQSAILFKKEKKIIFVSPRLEFIIMHCILEVLAFD